MLSLMKYKKRNGHTGHTALPDDSGSLDDGGRQLGPIGYKWARGKINWYKVPIPDEHSRWLNFCAPSVVDDFKFKIHLGTSLVVQWLRIRLPMQGTRVQALGREDPTCHRAPKPMRHNYWACALEPARQNYWARAPQLLKSTHSRTRVLQLLSLRAATTEARAPRVRAPQQEKPPQWEARAPQWRPNTAENK